MRKNMMTRGQFLASLGAFAALSACGLPRVGPNKREIFKGSVLKDGDAFIVSVNDRVTRATSVQPVLGFSKGFLNAGQLGSDTVRPGDTLQLRIWENVEDPLLGGTGQAVTVVDVVQVDGAGFIFVPYAGRIRAAGNTPERIRQIITEKLDAQTPDPQVVVSRAAGDGATVSVVGGVGAQGVYPIQRGSLTLSGMLALAGGIAIEQEIAQITVIRGSHKCTIWFEDLYSTPKFDIALRGGDRILVEADTRAFTVLGATGGQARVPFETQTLSAIEAIALVGGLNSNLADPTGVFVFRNEPEEIATQVLGRTDIIGDQRLVYVLNLTEPNGMFMARDFAVRDDDTIYVTEAPYAQFQKVLSALTGAAGSANSLASIADNNN